MKLLSKFTAILLGGLLLVAPASAQTRAQLIVRDTGDLFSSDAINRAKSEVEKVSGDRARQANIETFAKLDADDQKRYDELKDGDKRDFWKSWVSKKASGDKGIVVLINRSPGHVEVVADAAMRDNKQNPFTSENSSRLAKIFLDRFTSSAAADKAGNKAEAQKLRDNALTEAAEYIRGELPTKANPGTTNSRNSTNATSTTSSGTSIGSYLCIGIVVMLGIWLVIGLIRSMSGGGGNGGGGGMGGGGGGGGGGFMTSLMGGMFGAAAGMYLYNNMFGGGSSAAYGGDNGGGYNNGSPEAGEGNFGDSTGGDFGGGGGGGGDAGGGGFGGGGDFGGGGGGGGDF